MNTKFKMLIAEDDIISFELYKVRLEELEFNLIHAINGKIAVEMLKEHPDIQLILMDIRMPVLNGYESTNQIREFNQTIPIIAQTAFTYIAEQENILKLGFTDFLYKPVGEEKLYEMIRKYMNKE